MSLTFKQLKYFVAAAQSGQISRAGIELSISQSAITSAIRDMEQLLGAALFDRSAQGVILTEAGRRFLPQALSILTALEQAKVSVHQSCDIQSGIRIAASYTVTGYFIPAHLQKLARLMPQLAISLLEMPRESIEQALINQQVDFALMLTSNLHHPQIASLDLLTSPRRLWIAPTHKLAGADRLSLCELSRHAYIMLTVDEAETSALRYWQPSGCKPDIKLRTSSVEAVRSMVANGSGVTILSDMVYRPWSLDGQRIDTRQLSDNIPAMTVGIAWKKDQPFTPAMQAVYDYFRQSFLSQQLPLT